MSLSDWTVSYKSSIHLNILIKSSDTRNWRLNWGPGPKDVSWTSSRQHFSLNFDSELSLWSVKTDQESNPKVFIFLWSIEDCKVINWSSWLETEKHIFNKSQRGQESNSTVRSFALNRDWICRENMIKLILSRGIVYRTATAKTLNHLNHAQPTEMLSQYP